MKQRTQSGLRSVAATVVAASGLLVLAGCDGSSSQTASGKLAGSGAVLQQMQYGRLVDIYAYRRVDLSRSERRDTRNRTPVLIARNVVVDPSVQTQELFDAVGSENTAANYRFMPFDVSVGHEELLILWDDRVAPESERFQAAMNRAQTSLRDVPSSYRNQNTAIRPIPVVPRNAAIKLTFDEDLGLNEAFFLANPTALQVMEFRGDPDALTPQLAFQPVAARILPSGNSLIIDTSLFGGESRGSSSTGLPASPDQFTANIRIAIPTQGFGSSDLDVEPDEVPELNGVDANGVASVIRDFRAGNAVDGVAGALADTDAPSIVALAEMGIVAVTPDDPSNPNGAGVLTVHKRGAELAIRGRVPFVDGGVDATLPGGPGASPTTEPLPSGDFVFQDIVLPSGEVVRLRAEVIQNEDVGNEIGQPGFPGLGLTQSNTDGGELVEAQLRVASLVGARDSLGNPIRFEANSDPEGQDCVVQIRYYHNLPYTTGQAVLSDASPSRMRQFLVFDRNPNNTSPVGVDVDPLATVGLRLSEPMDLTVVQSHDNFLLSTDYLRPGGAATVEEMLKEPKPASLSVLLTRLVDQDGDGTHLRLVPPLGFFHELQAPVAAGETYWFHVLVGDDGIADLAGNVVDIYDRRVTNAETTFSVSFTLDPNAPDNLVGSRVHRFESIDEDGTPSGSADYFGQFQIGDGELAGALVQRFSTVADQQGMSSGRMTRWNRGECFDRVTSGLIVPIQAPVTFWGSLYLCPSMVVTQVPPNVPNPWINPVPVPITFGGVLEPHNPRGSRLQMTYREDDLQLEYTDPGHLNLDLEQLHWAPWNNSPVLFDTFDRVTISAAHADVRPDLNFELICPSDGSNPDPTTGDCPDDMEVPVCNVDCGSLNSGLSPTFADNTLVGSEPVPLVQDKLYQVNPNSAFKNEQTATVFVPYATFERTYTWRDSRLLNWDPQTNQAVGLGGARQPDGVFPARDRAAFISSPWVPDEFPNGWNTLPGADLSRFTFDNADFRGDRVRDHDPIAMPLLLDFQVYSDDPANGVARGANTAHIGSIGACWPANGYYSTGNLGLCVNEWPYLRVHTSGGVDGGTLQESFVIDPANQTVATGGWILDPGLGDPSFGLYRTGPGDNHLHWAQADFVRKVSMVTFGFFDTQLPNQHGLDAQDPNQSLNPAELGWPGLSDQDGLPNFEAVAERRPPTEFGVADFVAVTDPPLSAQPAGTSITLEFRGADGFRNDGTDDSLQTAVSPIFNEAFESRFNRRGNIYNPKYACEAFRYAMPNSGSNKTSPRIEQRGMTPYVEQDDLDDIRDPFNGLLPRFINMRMVMQNDTESNPPVSPSLRSAGVAYRLRSK